MGRICADLDGDIVDYNLIQKVLFTEDEIGSRVKELGGEIAAYYKENYGEKEISIVMILKGGFIFLADLIRSIDHPLTVDFMAISSYESGSKDTGIVRLTMDLTSSIKGKNVLVVEDIIDTGLTLGYIVKVLGEKGPNSIQICTLLDRIKNRIADLPVRFRGFEIDSYFVVGYGLDFRQRWRNLPFICTLKEEAFALEE